MRAIVAVKGKQFLVSKGDVIRVATHDLEVGKSVELPVVLTADGAKVEHAAEANVAKATVVSHGLGVKIMIFKHHAKKRYRRKNGHRQGYTELRIDEITPVKA